MDDEMILDTDTSLTAQSRASPRCRKVTPNGGKSSKFEYEPGKVLAVPAARNPSETAEAGRGRGAGAEPGPDPGPLGQGHSGPPAAALPAPPAPAAGREPQPSGSGPGRPGSGRDRQQGPAAGGGEGRPASRGGEGSAVTFLSAAPASCLISWPRPSPDRAPPPCARGGSGGAEAGSGAGPGPIGLRGPGTARAPPLPAGDRGALPRGERGGGWRTFCGGGGRHGSARRGGAGGRHGGVGPRSESKCRGRYAGCREQAYGRQPSQQGHQAEVAGSGY